jgi:hypothetical protein
MGSGDLPFDADKDRSNTANMGVIDESGFGCFASPTHALFMI